MVPYADPSRGERPATLRDARKYGWAPGVTEVLRVLSAPALTEWRIAEAVKLTQSICREHPHMLALAPEALVEHVKASTDTSKRDLGTEIHRDIELAAKEQAFGNREIVRCVFDALDKEFPGRKWVAETACYGEFPKPYGGTIDLITDDGEIVVDVKTKESLGKSLQYDEHRMQLVAYRYASGAQSQYNLFVDYTGDVEIVGLTTEQQDRASKMFRHALELWYLKTGL